MAQAVGTPNPQNEEKPSLNASKATAFLAVIAAIFLLHWGAPFFIPLFIALMIAFALSPLVDVIERVVRWREGSFIGRPKPWRGPPAFSPRARRR